MTNTYSEKDINVLSGLEHVRHRPSMYIGDVGSGGLHHLVSELVDNGVDEVMAGHANRIEVILHSDGSCEVSDNGRGIPCGKSKDPKFKGRNTLEIAMTELFSGGKFNHDVYKTSGGLHGIGMKAVSALSAINAVKVYRDGGVYSQRYSKGVPDGGVSFKKSTKDIRRTGTVHRFFPDPDIFETTHWEAEIITKRLKELSCLLPGLHIHFEDQRKEPFIIEEFKSENGIRDLFDLVRPQGKELPIDPVFIESENSGISFSAVFGYASGFNQKLVKSYVNSIPTAGGGTHVLGMQGALIDHAKKMIEGDGRIKSVKTEMERDDVLGGTICIISAKVSDPKFQGQTKERLGNPEVRTLAHKATFDELELLFLRNPQVASFIKERVISAIVDRDATQKARQVSRTKTKQTLLPTKLADCTSNDSNKTELILVEGDSAGGSAKKGRDKNIQAILPLRGKPMNVFKATPSRILDNKEIQDISSALGLHLKFVKGKVESDLGGLRYNKIIIATDADSDGSHICCLIIGMFYKMWPQIISEGMLYLAQPPLFRVKSGKETKFFHFEEDMQEYARKSKNAVITRFKGLGEMNPDVLYETTFDPKKRSLVRVTIEDAELAENAIRNYLGDSVAARRATINAVSSQSM